MAASFESLPLPVSSPLPSSTAFSLINASSVSSLPVPRQRSSPVAPNFSALKIKHSFTTRFLGPVSSSSSSKLPCAGGRIVCGAEKIDARVPIVTDATWKSLVLDLDSPVMVEFWAPWCEPCKTIHPIIDDISKEYANKFKIYKINTDHIPSIAAQYGIRTIPTVLIFKGGEKKDAIIGAVPRTTLMASLEKLF